MQNNNKNNISHIRISNDSSINNLEDFAKNNDIDVSLLRETKPGVLVLPNNKLLGNLPENKNYFSQVTKNVTNVLKKGGLNVKIYEDGREKTEIILKSADIFLPTLFFFGSIPIGLALNILANWIYDKFIKDKKIISNSLKFEYLEVKDNYKVIKNVKIEGPANVVYKILKEDSNNYNNNIEKQIDKNEKVRNIAQNNCLKDYSDEQAEKAIKEAKTLLIKAKDKLKNNLKIDAEKIYRDSLVKIREAILWNPENDNYREFLHKIGIQIHDLFDCKIEPNQGQYSITCPVMLSHLKGGFSIGGYGTTICSICGDNIMNCEHTKGDAYSGIVAKRHHGICNICGKKVCKHQEGKEYNNVMAFGIITNMTLDHISYVENPANPLCAIEMYTLSKSDILGLLPETEKDFFIYGETIINCHHCKICKK